MNARPLQLSLLAVLWLSCQVIGRAADSKVYNLKLADVDGNEFSTTDGRVTLLVFVTSENSEDGQTVGDRVPDFCLGNPKYRMITIVKAKNHSKPVRHVFEVVARRRLDTAARHVQERYDRNKIQRAARRDVFAVIDFGATIAANFSDQSSGSEARVVVLGPNGELRQEWNELPSAEQLAAALK
jgi:hypothetical protein